MRSIFNLIGDLTMDKKDLERRTKQFALKVIRFVATLPKNRIGDIITYQLVKAATSVGANYREANRAQSRADFIHKLAVVEKESSESQYWLELCEGALLGDRDQLTWLIQEADELLSIFVSSGRTAKSRR
jgi:four helix bundle protein